MEVRIEDETKKEIKVEANGSKRVTEKRETMLKAIGKIIEFVFPEEKLFTIYINENRNNPERVYSVNFVFHTGGKQYQE